MCEVTLYNIKKADLNIFVETKLCLLDNDDTYKLTGFSLYRNDFSPSNIRTCYGTAVYVKNDLICTEIPYRFNVNNVEITVTVLSQPVPKCGGYLSVENCWNVTVD